MIGAVIGFDTSCYTTSVAAAGIDGKVICSHRKLLEVETGSRGLRQSEAVFQHVRQLPDLVRMTAKSLGEMPIIAVCASTRPREDKDSYMPVFKAGRTVAESVASMLRVPFFETDHQHGHFAAAAYESRICVEESYTALHLSGGTTDLVLIDGDQLVNIGGSLDLHAGQLVDRTGVALGLGFPSGPSLEVLARQGNAKAIIPVSMTDGGLSCHLSGAESMVQRLIADGKTDKCDLAAEVYDFLARTVARMALAGCEKTGTHQVLLAGGVSSSALFRELVIKRIHAKNNSITVCFGHPEFSGDNAAGVALIGARKIKNGGKENES